jgi:hypothetical protein
MKVPHSLQDFCKELKKTQLRGLRTIPAFRKEDAMVLTLAERKPDSSPSILILREKKELKFFSFPPEWILRNEGIDFDLNTIEKCKRVWPKSKKVLQYFEGNKRIETGVFSLTDRNFFEHLAMDTRNYIDLIYLDTILKDGSFFVPYEGVFSFYSVTVSNTFCTNRTKLGEPQDNIFSYFEGFEEYEEEHDIDPFFLDTLSIPEKVSYLNFFLEGEVPIESERVKLDLPFHYGCVQSSKEGLVVVFREMYSPQFSLECARRETKGMFMFSWIK